MRALVVLGFGMGLAAACGGKAVVDPPGTGGATTTSTTSTTTTTITTTGTGTGTGTATGTGTGTGPGTPTGGTLDYLEVTIDGTSLYRIDTTTPLCGGNDYVEQSIPVSSFADGASHTLTFHAETFALVGGITSFLVDQISLPNCGVGGAGGVSCVEAVADPSFEAGTPNPYWDEYSINWTTPLCDEELCGLNLSYEGLWYAWFGGIGIYEDATLSQTVVIGEYSSELTFFLQVPTCDTQ